MYLKLQKQPNACIRDGGAPAQTIAFGHDSASAQWFDTREAAESHRPFKEEPVSKPEPIRVTVEEAAALQSFDPDLVWDVTLPNGRKISQNAKYQIIGNAVPVLLVEHVLQALWADPIALEQAA